MFLKIKEYFVIFIYTLRLICRISLKNFIVTISVSCLSGFFPFLVLIINQRLINELQMMRKPLNIIIQLVIAYFILSVVQNFFQNLSNYNLNKLNNITQYGINKILIEKCAKLSLEMLERTETYDVITRLEQEIAIKPYQTLQAIMNIFSGIVSLISASILIISWNWKIEIALIVISLSMFIGQIIIGNKEFMMKYNRSNKEREAWYFAYLLTHDTAFKEVKSYNLKDYFIDKYKTISFLFINQENTIEKYKTILNLGIGLIQDIFSLFIMIVTISGAYAGEIMIGTVMAYLNAITMIETSTNAVAAGIYSIYNSNLYMRMLKEFVENIEGEERAAKDYLPIKEIHKIELRNICFDYPEFKNVLQDISLIINSKEQIAIVGKNGSGKSTLFKILCGLYYPKSGEILINNKPIEKYSIEEYREKTSVIFQDFLKYEGSLKENVMLGDVRRDEIENNIEEALSKANVDFLCEEGKYNLGRILGNWFDNGNQLSGGQWQKIALARVYYKEADIYLLDEPSSALDAMAELKIFNSFYEMSKEKIAIYITHRVKIAKNATKIIVIDEGKIVGVGNHTELLKKCSVYRDLYEQESEE